MTQFAQNHFALFALPEQFALDGQALERAYRRVQSQVHPDRFAAASAAERRVAMQWAAQANEAYEVLRAPLKRAAYLCGLRGLPVEGEASVAMPSDFLMKQMAWREQLDEALQAKDALAIERLDAEVAQQAQALEAALAGVLDAPSSDLAQAASDVRKWMFVERFRQDVRAAVHALEDAQTQYE